MAFTKWSIALRGSLAGLVAVAGTATFGAEAEGVVRIRSADQKSAGVVVRGQSPCDCAPGCAPVISSKQTQSAAPLAKLILPKESPAPEPRVTPIAGQGAYAEQAAPAALPPAPAATGEYAQLFSSESAAPFNKPMQFADANPSAFDPSAEAEGITQTGHRRAERKCRHGNIAGQCPDGCPAEIACPPAASCQMGGSPVYYGECPEGYCHTRRVLGNNPLACKMRCCAMNHRLRSQQTSDTLAAMCHEECEEKWQWFRCKFGYFFPNGSGGKGSAILGHYSMVYPVNPDYQDPRDCQVYAAQGYYGPVAVPLAPVVHHTYNYGWGVPSSRLTPVSHPITGPYPY